MRHEPHIYVAGPWESDTLAVPDTVQRHLETVLRYPEGGAVSYTDGNGMVGQGTWSASAIGRGDEEALEALLPRVHVVVAPPKSKERQRFCVEKLQELGVAELSWLWTSRTQAKPPNMSRVEAWVTSALEQSRGAWRMTMGTASISDVTDGFLAHQGAEIAVGDLVGSERITLVVGPEGGLSDDEVSQFTRRASISSSVLRTETAAVAGAAILRG